MDNPFALYFFANVHARSCLLPTGADNGADHLQTQNVAIKWRQLPNYLGPYYSGRRIRIREVFDGLEIIWRFPPNPTFRLCHQCSIMAQYLVKMRPEMQPRLMASTKRVHLCVLTDIVLVSTLIIL